MPAANLNLPVQKVINILNSGNPNILSVQRFMPMAQVQRAAKLGDVSIALLRRGVLASQNPINVW
jgi:hypothetical protein